MGPTGVPQAPGWRRGGPWAPEHAGHLCHLPRGPDHNDDPFQGLGASSPWRPVLGISDLACPHCSSVPSQALGQNACSQLPTTSMAPGPWRPPQACPALPTPAWACPLSTKRTVCPPPAHSWDRACLTWPGRGAESHIPDLPTELTSFHRNLTQHQAALSGPSRPPPDKRPQAHRPQGLRARPPGRPHRHEGSQPACLTTWDSSVGYSLVRRPRSQLCDQVPLTPQEPQHLPARSPGPPVGLVSWGVRRAYLVVPVTLAVTLWGERGELVP